MAEEIVKSCGNLYKDLGYEDSEEMEARATLAREIYKIVKKKALTQQKVAELLNVPQSTISRLLQGNLGGFSTDRLFRFLNRLGIDITIDLKPSKRRKKGGRLSVTTSSSRQNFPIAAKSK